MPHIRKSEQKQQNILFIQNQLTAAFGGANTVTASGIGFSFMDRTSKSSLSILYSLVVPYKKKYNFNRWKLFFLTTEYRKNIKCLDDNHERNCLIQKTQVFAEVIKTHIWLELAVFLRPDGNFSNLLFWFYSRQKISLTAPPFFNEVCSWEVFWA